MSKKSIGTYIPPAKRVKKENLDVGSEDYQRFAWDDCRRKITGSINRANSSNIKIIVRELFNINLVRYKGLFASALLRAQDASPIYTDVYAAILAIINSRMETIGLLVINRLILQYRLSFVNNNKSKCLSSVKLIAHLINQEVMHEVLGFQLIDHLINQPTPSSIEIVIAFLKECGAKLDQLNSSHLFDVFRTLRYLSLENQFDTRTHDLIDLIHVIRKDKFSKYPSIKPELDLIDEDDKVTHTIELAGPRKDDFHMEFNYFRFDPKWSETELKYDAFRKSLLEDDDDECSSSGGEDNIADVEKDVKPKLDEKPEVKQEEIIDATGGDLIAFRRMVYLTFKSSISSSEVVHKLLKSAIEQELNDELCQMILDCCGHKGTYETIYGLVASKLCEINRREFAPKFEDLFTKFYESVHRFETNKIRNIAKFYSHLLTTESINWLCLDCLKLRENATTSAGRCFIKFLFQELVATLSMDNLLKYIKEQEFKDLLPKDSEEDMRFAIDFFTLSGLGKLVDDLRQELVSRQ